MEWKIGKKFWPFFLSHHGFNTSLVVSCSPRAVSLKLRLNVSFFLSQNLLKYLQTDDRSHFRKHRPSSPSPNACALCANSRGKQLSSAPENPGILVVLECCSFVFVSFHGHCWLNLGSVWYSLSLYAFRSC